MNAPRTDDSELRALVSGWLERDREALEAAALEHYEEGLDKIAESLRSDVRPDRRRDLVANVLIVIAMLEIGWLIAQWVGELP